MASFEKKEGGGDIKKDISTKYEIYEDLYKICMV